MGRYYFISGFVALCNLAFAQGENTFQQLRRKADSAYFAHDYSLSAGYYDKAIDLEDSRNNKPGARFYYKASCSYALNNEIEKALRSLESSFTRSHEDSKKNPVSGAHILSDNDLRSLGKEPQFIDLLQRYYPGVPIDLLTAEELSYEQMNRLIQYMLSNIGEDDEDINIHDKLIYFRKEDNTIKFNEGPLPFPDLHGKKKFINFTNCNFQLNFTWIDASQSYVGLGFNKCQFNGLFILHNVSFIVPPKFYSTTFNNNLYVNINVTPEFSYSNEFALMKCRVKWAHTVIKATSPIEIKIIENIELDSSDFGIYSTSSEIIQIEGNKFQNKNLSLRGDVNTLFFKNNSFHNIFLNKTNIHDEFDFQSTSLSGKLLMDRTFFNQDPVNDIDWAYLDNYRLGKLTSLASNSAPAEHLQKVRSFTYLSGEKVEDISNAQSFRELMGLYSMFLNLYKNKNDIESYNRCFIAIKDLQSRRLNHLYNSNKTFESYFRWKLSQLMEFYVRHGTDPARAIVISIYIIIAFGIFFFFFPSDWDETSKKKLIENYRDFVQKNEKGYIKPFFILAWGFLVSLVNAVTLSLNAFVTLGFGNIPTHGLARYVCVLEGFLGWFLLSIFTVALINQVL